MESTKSISVSQSLPASPWPSADRARIVSTEGICGGRPRIDGHRITVEDVAIWHERQGMTPDEIVTAYPSITLADVHAALAYYFEHRERIDQAIADGQRYAADMMAQTPSLLQKKREAMKANAADDSVSPR